MKKVIYIMLIMVMGLGLGLTSCSGYDADSNGIVTPPKPDQKPDPKPDPTPDPTPTPTPEKDSVKWSSVIDKALPIDDHMIARPVIYWSCTTGAQDSCKMEPWVLDIVTTDMTVYRNKYEKTTRSGKSLDSERSSDEEKVDKLGNLVKRHHYTQPYLFNNFTHSISSEWTTGRIFYGQGKEEAYLPEEGIYYDISYHVGDSVHFTRNDTIYAREDVKISYTITLKVTAKNYTWRKWEKEATVTVISFIGLVPKPEPEVTPTPTPTPEPEPEATPEPEITADDYIPNLEWHTAQANRFFNGSQWCDGILLSSADKYYMLVATFTLNNDKTKEQLREMKMYSIAKSTMATPTSGREYNAVMWDESKNQPIPCRLTVDGNGWGLGSVYADGTRITKRHERGEGVISGVKNLSEKDNATPTPWIASSWTDTKPNGKNHFSVTWKTTTHTLSHSFADSNLKK